MVQVTIRCVNARNPAETLESVAVTMGDRTQLTNMQGETTFDVTVPTALNLRSAGFLPHNQIITQAGIYTIQLREAKAF